MISKGIENKIASLLESMNGQEGARVGYEYTADVMDSKQPVHTSKYEQKPA